MDKTIQLNLRLKDLLQNWDPFHMGTDFYDTEIADCIQAVHQFDDANSLAKKIQKIYEFSFEEKIALAECLNISWKLLQIKNDSSCELN
ncbi:hypothetical protein J2S13_002962 [Oikeobacillus pervagus]|uniref:DUF1871 family protein n=1 Tax=Oikeobacillus pervagus TaxID=1325931 RepID=A0AAJ1T4B1_9BACI|nr:DUF1871 family protein [Oikeobacillus pervagus]MDQ0216502.1 hypothetical protein [Oikeobacillus pervagus]